MNQKTWRISEWGLSDLDILIEKEVFGRDIDLLVQETWLRYRSMNAGKGMKGTEPYDPNERDRMLSIAIPRHSLNIEVALKAVDKILETWDVRPKEIEPAFMLKRHSDGKWVACFGLIEEPYESDYWHIYAEGDTAAYAICVAALKVVGGTK